MTNSIKLSYDDNWKPKYLHFLAAALIAVYLTTNVIAAKQAEIFGFVVTAGTLTFPFVLVLGDVIAEIYGYRRSRQVIFSGFFAMIFFLFITQIALLLPSAASWNNQPAYEIVLGIIPRIIVASLTTYIASDLVNAFIMSRMKISQGAKGFARRAVASTVVAQAVDGLIFYPMAFLGIIPTPVLVEIFFTSWAIKVALEILALPVTTMVVKYLKRLEGIEHFDERPQSGCAEASYGYEPAR